MKKITITILLAKILVSALYSKIPNCIESYIHNCINYYKSTPQDCDDISNENVLLYLDYILSTPDACMNALPNDFDSALKPFHYALRVICDPSFFKDNDFAKLDTPMSYTFWIPNDIGSCPMILRPIYLMDTAYVQYVCRLNNSELSQNTDYIAFLATALNRLYSYTTYNPKIVDARAKESIETLILSDKNYLDQTIQSKLLKNYDNRFGRENLDNQGATDSEIFINSIREPIVGINYYYAKLWDNYPELFLSNIKSLYINLIQPKKLDNQEIDSLINEPVIEHYEHGFDNAVKLLHIAVSAKEELSDKEIINEIITFLLRYKKTQANKIKTESSLTWQLLEQRRVVESGEREIIVDYHFSNSGSSPVTIGKIKSSCSCFKAALSQRTYLPGESGVIVATFSIGDRLGKQKFTLEVETDEQDVVPIVLRMDLSIKRAPCMPRNLTKEE